MTRYELPHSSRDALAEAVEAAQFGVVRLREGYDQVAVDNFLDDLAGALRSSMTVEGLSQLVDEALFPVRMLRGGYDLDDVDDFLDEVVQAASEIAPSAVDQLANYYAGEAARAKEQQERSRSSKEESERNFAPPAPPVAPLAEAMKEAAESQAEDTPQLKRLPTRRELRLAREKAEREAAERAAAQESSAPGSDR